MQKQQSPCCSPTSAARSSLLACGDDELAVREGAAERAEDAALPGGVEVKLDFVDQDDGFALKRITVTRIGDREATREVGGERKE
jgi:hypothetical protein